MSVATLFTLISMVIMTCHGTMTCSTEGPLACLGHALQASFLGPMPGSWSQNDEQNLIQVYKANYLVNLGLQGCGATQGIRDWDLRRVFRQTVAGTNWCIDVDIIDHDNNRQLCVVEAFEPMEHTGQEPAVSIHCE